MGGGFIDALITIWMDMGLPWTSQTPMYITVIGAAVLFPFFLRSIRISQARNMIKRSNSLYHTERAEMEEKAIQRVHDIPVALLGLADQAISMKRTKLAESILSRVPRTKKYRREIERIEHRIQPKKSLDHWSQIQKIKTLIEQEMFEAARIQRTQIANQYSQEPDILWIDEQLTNNRVAQSD